MEKKTNSLLLIAIFMVLSLLGIADALYLAYAHYKPGAADFCDIKPDFDCDIVNTSEFSTIDGIINFLFNTDYYIPIPMAGLSFMVFLLLFIISLILYCNKVNAFESGGKIPKNLLQKLSFFFYSVINIFLILFPPMLMIKICRLILFFSAIFGIFLLYIQGSILMTWCLMCIILDVIIFSSLITVMLIRKY